VGEGSVRRLAAVDIGTVTTRLLIADVSASAIAEVSRSTDITHLGEGLTETGRLSEEAISRVATVIEFYAREVAARDVEAVAAVSTSAARDAANKQDYLGALEAAGIRPEIISGEREAALSFAGATAGIEGKDLLVVDVGGGSTELVMGDAPAGAELALSTRSLDVGSRRITEMFLSADPPTNDEIHAALEYVDSAVGSAIAETPVTPSRMISVAGTATSLAAIEMRMADYDADRVHGSTLDEAQMSRLLGMLASLPLREREHIVGLHPGRTPVIVAGALILGSVLKNSGLKDTTISDHDILYGILLDTYAGRA
jgi:exopolyphosphatase/guanosine-5'-triphosphate,3'-diphosphate pyrophosphatase